MLSKFFLWLNVNRKPIGYTFGYLNLFLALVYLVQGEIGLAMLWTVIGGFIVYDTWEEK